MYFKTLVGALFHSLLHGLVQFPNTGLLVEPNFVSFMLKLADDYTTENRIQGPVAPFFLHPFSSV